MVKSGKLRLVNGTVSPNSDGLQAVITDLPTGPPIHQLCLDVTRSTDRLVKEPRQCALCV
jgi:hypothetical protein